MALTTVTDDPNSLLHLSRVTADDEAWQALTRACAAPHSYLPAVVMAAGSFRPRRDVGQDRFDSPGMGRSEGRTFTLTIGPGLVGLAVSDAVRAERAAQRVADAHQRDVQLLADRIAEDPDYRPAWLPARYIQEWSWRSRRRMMRAFMAVDWSALGWDGAPLGMVTLTYPGDWLAVAPSGRAVKRHLKLLRLRFGRAVGRRLDGAWKLEFQGRGAPHFHILMPCPSLVQGVPFESWLSRTWAGIVKADDQDCSCGVAGCLCPVRDTEYRRHLVAGTGVDFGPTGRATDPKRLGVYFMKHGQKTLDDKEYQHFVPRAWLVNDQGEPTPENGPGRFWGMWGLPPATAAVELDQGDFDYAKRILRRVARARARSIQYAAARRSGLPADLAIQQRRRKSATLASSRMVGGFVVVNDGPRLGLDLARALNLARLPDPDGG